MSNSDYFVEQKRIIGQITQHEKKEIPQEIKLTIVIKNKESFINENRIKEIKLLA